MRRAARRSRTPRRSTSSEVWTPPYGDPDKGPLREAVLTDSKLAVRTAALGKIHHCVGDGFSIEHIWPTPMLEFFSFQELLNMPGVFIFTWDNCQYEEISHAPTGAYHKLSVLGALGQGLPEHSDTTGSSYHKNGAFRGFNLGILATNKQN